MIIKKLKVGSDFSGIGAFDQALRRLGVDYETEFSCDTDKYVRQSYIANYGEPKYYPENVYERNIPENSLDIFMTSPPCQSFSLVGKRKGENDERGVLFYNSYEFIKKNKPRYFIFENVKGLLSDNNTHTFQKWINHLGGKTVNNKYVLFPSEEALPYHVYHKVLNTKDFGIPQNRERVFIVGIRDDEDNDFKWPIEIPLEKRLKDVLETEVDEKYYLSDKMINYLDAAKRSLPFSDPNKKEISNCILSNQYKMSTDQEYFKVKSATKKGYEEAKAGDSINFSQTNSKTRRGRVGKEVAQTLDTACSQAVIGAMRGRNTDNPKSRESGLPTEQHLEINENGTSNCLTSVQKDNLVILGSLPGKHEQSNRVYDSEGISTTINSEGGGKAGKTGIYSVKNKIRRLTVLECFRLQDFPDEFVKKCKEIGISDTQLYKQAGNSISVCVLEAILKNLLHV